MVDNPPIATLRGPDDLGLFAIGFCFGIGFALLLVGFIFRGELDINTARHDKGLNP